MSENSQETTAYTDEEEAFVPESEEDLRTHYIEEAVANVSLPGPYPVDALGPIMAGAVKSIQQAVECPAPLVAQAVLASASLAVQHIANVEMPAIRKPTPLSIYTLTIAASGERKSTTFGLALAPHLEFEDLSIAHYNKDVLPKYEEAMAEWREEKRSLRGPEPRKPSSPILLMGDDFTIDGMLKYLIRGRPSIGVMSPEAGVMMGGYSMGAEQKMRTMAVLNNLWDGARTRRVRSGGSEDGEVDTIKDRRVAMGLMMQETAAYQLFNDNLFADLGLLARFLPWHPEPMVGQRMGRTIRANTLPEYGAWCRRITALLAEPCKTEGENDLRLRTLRLDDDAEAEILDFYYMEMEPRIPSLGVLSGWVARFMEHVIRIAGVIALVESPNEERVTLEHAQRALQLMRFYYREIRRMTLMAGGDDLSRNIDKVLAWMRRMESESGLTDGYLPLRDVSRLGPVRGEAMHKVAEAVRKTQLVQVVRGSGGAELWRLWRGSR